MKSNTMRNIGYLMFVPFLVLFVILLIKTIGIKAALISVGMVFWIFAAICLIVLADEKKLDEEYDRSAH